MLRSTLLVSSQTRCFHRTIVVVGRRGLFGSASDRFPGTLVPNDDTRLCRRHRRYTSTSTTTNAELRQFVYESPLAKVVTRLRTVSLTTGIIGSVGLPLILACKGGDLPSAGYLGLAMAFVSGTLGSTAAIHFVFSPYVYSIERIPVRQCHAPANTQTANTDAETKTHTDTDAVDPTVTHLIQPSQPKDILLKAISKGLFLNQIETVFDPKINVAKYKGLRPLCNLRVKDRILYVHPEFVYDDEMRRQMDLDVGRSTPVKENPDDDFF